MMEIKLAVVHQTSIKSGRQMIPAISFASIEPASRQLYSTEGIDFTHSHQGLGEWLAFINVYKSTQVLYLVDVGTIAFYIISF